MAVSLKIKCMALVLKNPPANAGDTRDCWFDLWVRRIPWRRAWQPTTVFLPRESHGQKSLAGYSPWVTKSQTQLMRLSKRTRTFTRSIITVPRPWTPSHQMRKSERLQLNLKHIMTLPAGGQGYGRQTCVWELEMCSQLRNTGGFI